jgi:hypothetical protein
MYRGLVAVAFLSQAAGKGIYLFASPNRQEKSAWNKQEMLDKRDPKSALAETLRGSRNGFLSKSSIRKL